MQLLDQILDSVSLFSGNRSTDYVGNGSSSKRKLIGILAGLLASGRFEGLSGLFERFNNNGMQNQLASWISTRPNEQISAAQIEQAFGHEAIEEIAGQIGLNRSETSRELAEVVPQFIDKLTPTGVTPPPEMLDRIFESLSK